jgi:hypothetical protein
MSETENKGRPPTGNDLSKVDGSGSAEMQLTEATGIAQRVGKEITANFRSLAPRQRRGVVTAFRRQLFPPAKPGRRRSKEITAAYTDWAAGMRGLALYRKHIRRFEHMGYWQRKVKTRALMDAIRARNRRERKTSNRPADLHGSAS